MPESPRSQRNLTRRRFLATGASVATAALAGCNGLPGGSKTFETVVHENSGDELSWDFPTQSEAESVGYVEIGREPTFDTDDPIASRGFHFNASVDPDSSYKLEQFTGTFAAPPTYGDHLTYLVSPPRQSDAFRTYYQYPDGPTRSRQFVVEMRNLGIEGTVEFPFVIRNAKGLPDKLECSFSIQASDSGLFVETATASATGTFEFR